MAAKGTEWRPGPSVCRCCFAEGCYKDISTEYFWMGKREVYSEMLTTTFDINIAYSQSGGPNSNSRLICEPCISRLRDAADFKRQVQECERVFLQHLDPVASRELEVTVQITPESPEKEVKLERVKVERKLSDDDFEPTSFPDDDDDDDDMDDEPLTKLASKVPKKESVDLMDLLDNAKAEKRKSTTKVKATPAKKVKKKEAPKPSASNAPPKTEKKKKGEELVPIQKTTKKKKIYNKNIDDRPTRIKHATILLENSKICPFKWMKNLYLCFYCDERFNDPADLRDHNEIHKLNGDDIKNALLKLKKYELIKVDVTNVHCKLCVETVTDFNSLKLHLVEEHKKNMDVNLCDGVLPFKISKSEFNCALCIQQFEEFTSLNHHMNVHFQNFICETCGSGFMTPERLRSHSFSHETGSFPCDGCNKVFRSSNAKNEHYDRVHKKVQRHRCPNCPETFRNYYQRNKHISTVHGLKIKEFKCAVCFKVFTSSGKLGVHKNMVHLKLKRFSCDACEWKFYSKSELEAHMIRHNGERKYQCNVCKKAYARKYTLREHMRIHEKDKRFVCSLCGRSFVQNCSLKHHMKVHHPNSNVKGNVYEHVIV